MRSHARRGVALTVSLYFLAQMIVCPPDFLLTIKSLSSLYITFTTDSVKIYLVPMRRYSLIHVRMALKITVALSLFPVNIGLNCWHLL